MEYILEQVADRSPNSCSEVAERSPISRRPIADQSPTSFSDSHALILTKLVGDRSATSRRLIGDWSATLPGPVCDQISRSQVFVRAQKTLLRLIWSQRGPRSVADFSATSPGPIGDLVATSAIGVNYCQSRRGRKAVATYVWPGLYLKSCSLKCEFLLPHPFIYHIN